MRTGVSVNSQKKYTNIVVLQVTVPSQTNRQKLAPFSKAEVQRSDQGGPCNGECEWSRGMAEGRERGLSQAVSHNANCPVNAELSSGLTASLISRRPRFQSLSLE